MYLDSSPWRKPTKEATSDRPADNKGILPGKFVVALEPAGVNVDLHARWVLDMYI
jgi:hypothetical protein